VERYSMVREEILRFYKLQAKLLSRCIMRQRRIEEIKVYDCIHSLGADVDDDDAASLI
jgi:hypothetical protein